MHVFDRRTLLKSGCLTLGGFSLGEILRLRAASAQTGELPENTAVIFVMLGGGPSQFETFDPKPEAPVEYRGPFGPIATSVAGVRFCELLPQLAASMNNLAIVRSVHHEQASHIAMHIIETGYDLRNSANSRTGEMPSVGSVVSRVRGRNPSGIPGYVAMPRLFAYAGPHWLGSEHQHFAVRDDPNADDFKVDNIELNEKLDLQRLQDRRSLSNRLDRLEQVRDLAGDADALDAFSQQAFDLITGDKAREAFAIDQEPDTLRDRYGRNSLGQRMLLARRLVEAGVPFVKVRMGDWDDHEKLPDRIPQRALMFDTGLSTLLDDLRQRGMSRNVLVVAMGEFGRTPRVNAKAGRDHWPAVNSVLLAGGRFQMGQVIGSTDAKAARVSDAPYRPQNVLAMVYHHLGIDPARTFPDYSGRPRYVLEERRRIRELL